MYEENKMAKSRRYSFRSGVVKAFKMVNNGAYVLNRVGVSSDYTVKNTDYIVGVDSSGGTYTVTIPSSVISEEGRVVIINDEGANANNNNISVATEGSENIDGSGSATISSASGTLALYSDGSNLFSY